MIPTPSADPGRPEKHRKLRYNGTDISHQGRVDMIKGVLLDLSGTLYVGNEIIPGAREVVVTLRRNDIPVRYLTNTSRSTRTDIFTKLLRMGFDISEEEFITAPAVMNSYLKEHHLKPWLLVHPSIRGEFDTADDPQPDAVVVCDAAESFTYENLNAAFRLLLEGARLIAIGDNRYFKEEDGMSLDAGPFVRALEYAANCEAIILGKPSPAFFHSAADQLGCKPAEVLMVGDDVYSDVNGALKAGLVRTGKYRPGDERKISAPGACVCSDLKEALADLV